MVNEDFSTHLFEIAEVCIGGVENSGHELEQVRGGVKIDNSFKRREIYQEEIAESNGLRDRDIFDLAKTSNEIGSNL